MIKAYQLVWATIGGASIVILGSCSNANFLGASKSKSASTAAAPGSECPGILTQSDCTADVSCQWGGTPAVCTINTSVTSGCSDMQTQSACTADTSCQWGGTPAACTATPAPGGGTGPNGTGTITDQGYVGGTVPTKALTPTGTITDECRSITALPTTSTKLVLQYNWHASGDKAAFTQVVATPIVGRLKAADAAPTILAVGFQDCGGDVTQPAYLFAIDGSNGAQKWVSALQVRAWLPPAIGDLNNDGTMRIAVVGMDNLLHVLNSDGSEKFVSTEPVFDAGHDLWPNGLAVADLALDGHTEVIAGNKIYDGTTGHLKFKVSGNGFSAVGDTDGQAGLEVVTSSGIFSGKDGTAICTFATPIEDPAIAVMHAADDHAMVIGIAGATMAPVGGAPGDVLVYDGKNCSLASTIAKTQSGGGPINIADFDGDGTLDFGMAGYDGYMASHINAIMWTAPAQDHSSSVTGSTTFDFNGAGKNEVIYADEIHLHVFDGTTGKEIYTADHASFTAREYPVVADVTGSGKARIVVAANSCVIPGATINGIRVFKDPADAWVQTRPIWNQHAYNPLLVTVTGGLTGIRPETIWKPWLGAAYLAGFRNNIPKPAIKASCQ